MERNAAQEKAIHHSSGPMMLLAGPGSGKTTTMIRRIRALLSEQHINPANILVVTFTKAAAREMKERFEKLCEKEGEQQNYRQVTSAPFTGFSTGF